MKTSTKLRLAAFGAGVIAIAALAGPASAATVTISDSDGNDFDAAALVSDPTNGDPIVTVNDGSAESTDIRSVSLTTSTESWNGGAAEGTLTATVVVDGKIPAEGSASATDPNWDGPSPNFVGGGYRVLYSNQSKQTNGDNIHSGCTRLDGGRVRDQRGHWRDGYRYYIGLSVTYTGTEWAYLPEVGEYDPSPDGGFFFTDLESEPASAGRYNYTTSYNATTDLTTITVKAAGLVKSGDATCNGDYEQDFYAAASDGRPGAYSTGGDDVLSDVFSLTTVDEIVTLPITVPTAIVTGDDTKAIGGFVFYSDTTTRNGTGDSVYEPGLVGVSDTLGDGPTCPTPTFGGTVPSNPLAQANPNQPCQIDDDLVVSATGEYVLSEWLRSGYNPA